MGGAGQVTLHRHALRRWESGWISGTSCLETTMSDLGDVVRVLWQGDPLAPAFAEDALPDLAVWETVPFVAPDACSHEGTMCAECRRSGWSDYYVEGRDIPSSAP